MSTAPPGLAPAVLREIEGELADLRYRDMPIGQTLNDQLVINLLWGHGDWRRRARWLNQVNGARHLLRPMQGGGVRAPQPRGRVLVTWQESTPRIDEMLLPVLDEVGPERCVVLVGRGGPPPGLPRAVQSDAWERAINVPAREWRAQYRRSRPGWNGLLKDVCRRHDLPEGAFELLSLQLLVSSQRIEGALGLLEAWSPSVVLTEYDRSYLWSCLTLAARQMQIPTVTLVHGVMPPDALGFSPVLADLIICWGESDRAKLLAAGEPAEKVVIGGCPRLTRELPLGAPEARGRLGLDSMARVALLATSPDRGYLDLAELFCAAVGSVPGLTGVVRLHPAEAASAYAEVSRRHPAVRFMENAQASLDESLAAADFVVARGSGVGSDALIKRRTVIVLSPGADLVGNDWDLVNMAGCPLARSQEELADVLGLLASGDARAGQPAEAAEKYVNGFCGAFGQDSARLIGATVKDVAASARLRP